MKFEIADVMFTDLEMLEQRITVTFCRLPTCVCLDSSRYITKISA